MKGYAINEKRLNQKQQEVQTFKEGIRILSRRIGALENFDYSFAQKQLSFQKLPESSLISLQIVLFCRFV
ncbi:hypothetical protein [Dyadobacter sp. CY312]|uniref:hypothetical protein n=1 Tax=Dyadobacter sp. CY312 TaxID=2907303 RepID=UPI001F183FD9|nr:hypothetical protein [Dyadobacter sp. CY312]MCE7042779.1 hypothetical protein [Dyadobacter sp. CY312]